MNYKKRYLDTFIINDGLLNEIDLGATIGLNEDETMKIIAKLLQEHKIEYTMHKACNYCLMKKRIAK
ncbi:hypothetical protein [Hyunsoonleella pacifica]|uniref:Uncharacterized protein n=1 Tax=Hyunsoonleella pacifica TaxID=1080224 RepID=A0A4Q9FRS5_9FLAO|nr:hypothetical protein [Hyunsoonleella pacifica]TBN18607.1 hypothetical protein EYD46_00640 [Hyunsoonleella pacifica]GGD03176.1 hypothetical protein GCM10011368_01280 [Hyunsoonleella pacifica]